MAEYIFEYNPSKYGLEIDPLTISSDGKNITGLWIQNQKYFGSTLETENIKKDLSVFKLVETWLDTYFSGQMPTISLPLAPKGSLFRQEVWKILCDIPYGEVITYGDIAKLIANQAGKDKMSARAVGGAVGHNPISIIIPCHRVIGSNGNLTGYSGGIDVKIKLLTLEHICPNKFYNEGNTRIGKIIKKKFS